MYGPYWRHLKEVWERRDHPNLHIMYYEDMKKDIMVELHKLNKFLDTHLTEQQLLNIAKYTGFDVMKVRAESVMIEKKDEKAEAKTESSSRTGFNKEVMKKDGGFFRKGQAD